MARNYSMAEAVRIVREGTDKAALIDLGKKFPMVLYHLTKLDGNGMDFVSMLPAKITTRKMESILRGGVEVDDEVETEDNEEVAESKVAKSTEAPAPKPWKSMSQYQKTKARALGAEYVAACKKLDKAEDEEEEDQPAEKPVKREKRAKKVKEAPKAEEEDEDDEDEEEPMKKPAKKAKKPAKKAVEEDEDDDFDFDFDEDDE